MKDWHQFSSRPYEAIDIALLSVAPPRHTQVRQLMGRQLGPAILDGVLAFAERRAADLLNPRLDAVTEFAEPLSREIAAQLIGLDEDDAEFMLQATRDAYATPDPWIAQFAAIDRVAPRSGMYRDIAGKADGSLAPAEVGSLVRLLWAASTATSERLISSCVLRLLHHPSVREDLVRDPARIPAFIEEIIRLHPPEPMIMREAVVDAVVGGATIPRGGAVKVCLPAVNRDPRRFDEPDRLRLDRGRSGHIGFGTGPHQCIGAALSRRTVNVAISVLLRAMPDFRAVAPAPPLRAMPPSHLVIES
jgi:cytochrome P450